MPGFKMDMTLDDQAVAEAVDTRKGGMSLGENQTEAELAGVHEPSSFLHVAAALPSIAIGALDSMGNTLGLLNDTDVEDGLKYMGATGLSRLYGKNKETYRALGDVATLFTGGTLGIKLLKSVKYAREAGSIGEWAKNSTALGRILGNSAHMNQLEEAVSTAAVNASKSAGVIAGRVALTPEVIQARRALTAARLVESVRTTTAFELGTQPLLAGSELFHPAEETTLDNAKWTGAGYAIGAGLEFVAARYGARALIRGAMAGAEAVGSTEASKFAETISRPGQRGVAVTTYATTKNIIKDNVQQIGDEVLRSNTKQDITFIDGKIVGEIEQLLKDDHLFVEGFVPDEATTKRLVGLLDKRPDLLLYATKMGKLPEKKGAFYALLHDAEAQAADDVHAQHTILGMGPSEGARRKAEKDLVAATARVQEVDRAVNEVHYVIENTGDVTVYANRADNWADAHSFGELQRSTFSESVTDQLGAAKKIKRSRLKIPGAEVYLNDDFSVTRELAEGGKLKKIANPDLSQEGRSALFAAASKMINEWKPIEGQVFELKPDMSWFQLEGLLNLAKRHPDAAAKLKLGEGFKSFEDVEFNILNQKYKGWVSSLPLTERVPVTAKTPKALRASILDPQDLRHRFNMPLDVGTRTHPMSELFVQLHLSGVDDLEQAFKSGKLATQPFAKELDNITAFKQGMKNVWNDADEVVKNDFEVSGNLFNQTDKRPIFVAGRSVPNLPTSDAHLMAMRDSMRDIQIAKLSEIDPKVAPLVAKMLRETIGAAPADVARQVPTLFDGLVSGRGRLTFQDRVNEQIAALRGMQLIAQHGDAVARGHIRQVMEESGIIGLFSEITQRKNYKSLFDVNRVNHAYRHGWDVEAVEQEGDRFAYALKDTPQNAQLKKRYFPQMDPEDVTHLPDMSLAARKTGDYHPLTTDKLASDMLSTTSGLSKQSGVENNELLKALGYNPITLRDFHLPTPELNREGTWFVRDDTGQVVATYTADNPKANQRLAQEASAKLSKVSKRLHTAVPMEDVKRQHGIYEDNLFRVTDYSDQVLKDGSRLSGGLTPVEIDTGEGTLRDMLNSLSEQYLQTAIRARATVFEPQINYARMASDALGNQAMQGANIFDRYIATAYSRAPIAEKDNIKQVYGAIERYGDQAITWMRGHFAEQLASSETGKAVARQYKGLVRKQTSEQAYNEFQKLADWSPFNSAAEFAESTYQLKAPVEVRNIASMLARTSSALSLRILDAGTMMLNVSSFLTNSPAVMRSLQHLPGEADEAYKLRTAAFSTSYLPSKNGADPAFRTFSTLKALASTAKGLFTGEFSAPMARAAKMGLFDPEYISLDKALNSATHQKGNIERFVEATSVLADKSEIASRKWAWAMGYKMGKELHGYTDERNAFIYANHIVNETIGNYAAHNKPVMFSGSVGLLVGAFQTYMFNYYRRLFGYVEQGNVRTLIAQYAAQSSLFGAAGTPGFGAFNSMLFADDHGGKVSTRVDQQMPEGVAELLLHGTLSGIPKIFGLDAPALYARGSVDATQLPPTIMDYSRAPAFQMLGQIWTGVGKTFDNVFSNEGVSIQQQAEIIAQYSTNRALRSVMEVAAGAKTDVRGQVIDGETRRGASIAAAIVGSVPTSTRRAQEGFYAQDAVEKSQAVARTKLNDKSRALFRSGQDISIAQLQAMVSDYQKSGGNPAYFGNWIRQSYLTATTPKVAKKLDELLGSKRGEEFLNLLSTMQNMDQLGPEDAQ